MDRRRKIERARALAVQVIALCDANGDAIAAGYVQLALDRMTQPEARVREERLPWGDADPLSPEGRRSES